MFVPDAKFLEAVYKFRKRIEEGSYNDLQKVVKLYKLFTIIITQVSDESKVQFTSLFARMSYINTSFQIPYKESYILHTFRKQASQIVEDQGGLLVGQASISILLAYVLKQEEDLSRIPDLYKKIAKGRDYKKVQFKREVKVFLKSIDTNQKSIEAQLCDEPFENILISYARPDRNEDYTDLFEKVNLHHLLPLTSNLVDVEIDDQKIYYPASIVFEPDYMYDVTAVSECFGAFANHQGGYLLRKFLKKPVSTAILIGNLSNYFLDQLVYSPKATFPDLIKHIFVQDPMGISLLSNQEVREMVVLLESHFDHIKEVVQDGLGNVNVTSDNCLIEPSFYSAKYGIQGRLDLFSISDKGAAIVELKSGSPFRANNYGLSNNHYHQTLLYDMLIESVYGSGVKRNNFILYSKENTNQLRYAPALKSEQREAIKERNQLYIHDRLLLDKEDFISYYQAFFQKNSNSIKGFLRKDANAFSKIFEGLDSVESIYSNLLLKFVLRELFINKLGDEGSERSSGLAALWRHDIESKKEQFNILNHLEIVDNSSNSSDPYLVLNRTELSADLSNFRVGDLGVFYPHQDDGIAILKHQVFKVTILVMTDESITVRLRSRQENASIFDLHKHWHIEHDTLDNGYYEMSRSIYEFAQAPKSYRELVMGRRAPKTYKVAPVSCGHHLTEEQSQIFSEIIKSKEYYLLWGPPGTGKTSVMLREVAEHFIVHENDRVLLLAYTNRAVDEICEALCSIDPSPSFVRIGSRYSTARKFHPYLLENQISDIKDRKSLRAKIAKEQVYVGTVASVVGKVSLFELVKFDLAIVDEASQILETSLIGLLSRVNKFILIGDHLQLPAVVRQNDSYSDVKDEELNELGYESLSSSLFERMYLRAQNQGWDHAIGQLTSQGRMHEGIMGFVNKKFYSGRLKAMSIIKRLTDSSCFKNESEPLHRLQYAPSKVDIDSDSIKINSHEAVIVSKLCRSIIERCIAADVALTTSTIGVITPYRAQIAAIKKQLSIDKVSHLELISIDTVERYQGGARDFIIMSCCMNYSFQLKALVSLSNEGVDRKLNVAITRAREQFTLIGNRAILEQNEVYTSLIESSSEI